MEKYILILSGLKKSKREYSVTQLKLLAICLTKHKNCMWIFWNCRRNVGHWLLKRKKIVNK